MDKTTKPLSFIEMAKAAKKRVSVISKEFSEGFDFLENYPRSVTIFGSTKSVPGDKNYEKAVRIAGRIVKELRYSVITGGGPGAMEAGNRGAYEAGGNSLGLTIELPKGQMTNRYLTDTVNFHYFFSRKVCMAYSAQAFIFMPGGFGTLNELMEILNLVQTAKIRKVPLILVGIDFWKPLIQFFNDILLKDNKFIDGEDITLFILTDDENEILKIIKEAPVELPEDYVDHDHEEKNIVNNFGDQEIIERPVSRFLKWR